MRKYETGRRTIRMGKPVVEVVFTDVVEGEDPIPVCHAVSHVWAQRIANALCATESQVTSERLRPLP